ncbi:hypothetical protein CNEO_910022 [Clostridium neonatale]|nr:hypothetical protein CNEO_910022 [Clostridium neonatale]
METFGYSIFYLNTSHVNLNQIEEVIYITACYLFKYISC